MRRGPGLPRFCRRRDQVGDRAPPTFVPSSTLSFTSYGQAASGECCHANFHRVARSTITFKSGKAPVERPFRTVKEMHETLYHFHEPKDEEEANAWLMNFLVRYNTMEHRYAPHSR